MRTILLVFLAGCSAAMPVPPAMPKRAIAPSSQPWPGRSVAMKEGEHGFTLFVPDAWKNRADGPMRVTIHFHTVDWFAIQEHLRRGLAEPLIVFNAGEGS